MSHILHTWKVALFLHFPLKNMGYYFWFELISRMIFLSLEFSWLWIFFFLFSFFLSGDFLFFWGGGFRALDFSKKCRKVLFVICKSWTVWPLYGLLFTPCGVQRSISHWSILAINNSPSKWELYPVDSKFSRSSFCRLEYSHPVTAVPGEIDGRSHGNVDRQFHFNGKSKLLIERKNKNEF